MKKIMALGLMLVMVSGCSNALAHQPYEEEEVIYIEKPVYKTKIVYVEKPIYKYKTKYKTKIVYKWRTKWKTKVVHKCPKNSYYGKKKVYYNHH